MERYTPLLFTHACELCSLTDTSVDGANAHANLYSLAHTAKANGHEPHSYIHHVLTKLPAAKTLEDIECLQPVNLQPQECMAA